MDNKQKTISSRPKGPVKEVALSSSPAPVYYIDPPSGWPRLDLYELWGYRDLLYFLIWRDIKIRYKQTVIGIFWAILQPLLTMAVFTVLFGRLVRVPTGEIPYPLFAYSALVPWTYFTHALTKAINSMIEQRAVITKVYFPRLILPIAAVSAAFMDFIVSFIVLLGMIFLYGWIPTAALITIPFFILLAIATALAIGLWLAALNVQYRDISNAMPFLMQIWLFVTPIAYPSSIIPSAWRWLYGLNPMTGVVEGFRWALLGTADQVPFLLLAVSTFAVASLLIGGLYFFRYKENYFADVV